MIKVTILLSTYNGEKYLRKQLDSICNQDVENVKISMIVRDDGSRDDTICILEDYKEKLNIELVKDECTLGPAKSFWKLLKEAPKSDYYAFVDQDDMWDSNKLSVAIDRIKELNGRVLWFSNCRLISDDDSVIKEKLHREEPILSIPSQLICGSAQGCSMVLNSEAVEYLKGITIERIPMHDLVAMEYILGTGLVVYDDIPRFGYRVHSNNAVAKAGKSFFKKKKAAIHSWFDKKNRGAIISLAKNILDNCEGIKQYDREFLELLAGCESNFFYRLRIVFHPLTRARSKAALRSFRIRVLLGIA